MSDSPHVRVGITLPSFVEDPEAPIAVARAAEAAGLDGVFAFDHLFREDLEGRRPALDCFTLLGAIASETERVAIGPLVARVTLSSARVLACSLGTLHRVSEGRLIAALGTGDRQNERENEEFGVARRSLSERIDALFAALRATRGCGYPVWIGGSATTLREAISGADGWNRWGGTPGEFAGDVASLRANPTGGAGTVAFTWGGLAVLGETDEAAAEKAERLAPSPGAIVGGPHAVAASLRAFVEAGASWVIVAPVDSSSMQNPGLLAEIASQLRAG